MTESEQNSRFREWYENHRGIIVKISKSFTNTIQDQQDLIQEISVQLWKSVPSFRDKCKESTWIYRVALNTAIAWSRKEKRKKNKERIFADDAFIFSQQENPENKRLDWLFEQLRKLDVVDRSLLLLHLEGQSYSEIAGILGTTEKNVGVKLSRLRKKLSQTATRDGI